MSADRTPQPSSVGPEEAATQALNAMTLHEKHGVHPHLAVTLAASGVVPDPRLLDEFLEEIDQ